MNLFPTITLIISFYLLYRVCNYVESEHLDHIRKREDKYRDIEMHGIKPIDYHGQTQICSQTVVIAISQFKSLIASVINIFGGAIPAYESVLDRARREAILRLIEKNPKAKAFTNLKVDTVNLGHGFVEAHAYATALL